MPTGITAGEIQWPTPEKLIRLKIGDDGNPVAGELDYDQTTYVLHDEAVLIVPLTIAPGFATGPLEIKAGVEWLECEVACVPRKSSVSAKLDIAGATTPSADAAAIAAWQNHLPGSAEALTPRASWAEAATGKSRPLFIEWIKPPVATSVDFFPEAGTDFEVSAMTEVLSRHNNFSLFIFLASHDGGGRNETSKKSTGCKQQSN